MMEKIMFIDEILAVGSLWGLFVFCALVPKTNIAKYLYILFGVTLIPVGIKSIFDGDRWYQFIWFFLFALVGIVMGIFLIFINSNLDKDEQKEFDESFGKASRRGGMRRLGRDSIESGLK